MAEQTDVGLIGLAVMGSNLALNIAEKGYRIAVYDRELEVTDAFVANSGTLSSQIFSASDIKSLVAMIKRPRSIILLIKAGSPVDQVIETLAPLLEEGDTIVDGGNTEFNDTVRRSNKLKEKGIHFVGLGLSGGEEGARDGPSLMFGGSEHSWQRIGPLLQEVAVKYNDQPCCAYMGPDGAGNFVKTIHNGIEYADMQMIAEIYGIMKDGFGRGAKEMAPVFTRWNEGELSSYLIEITAKVLSVDDDETSAPLVDVILDKAGQKGTGRWAVIEAQKLGVGATTIEAAVAARSLSADREGRLKTAECFEFDFNEARTQLSNTVSDEDLEQALLLGKIAAYAQGFSILEAARAEHQWPLPMKEIAEVWRAGCIIRSVFLSRIASVYATERAETNLLTAAYFADLINNGHQALRKVVSHAVLCGIPVPALASALSYIDGAAQAKSTANLIQAQRDCFGAHTYKRLDKEGSYHTSWLK
jgi:6-phosphogluconate dehydrogenase